MKKIYAVAVAAALMFSVAACGGSSDSGGGGGAAATDTAAQAATYQMVTGSSNILAEILGQMGLAAQVVKEDAGTVECSETGSTWTCELSDGQGGTATITGTIDDAAYTMNFGVEFTNFQPASDTTINGSFEWVIAYSQNFFNGYSSIKAPGLKSTAAKADETSCEYSEENYDGEGYCSETTEECAQSASNFLVSYQYTIGAAGLTYTDACGTYTFGANTTEVMNFCSDDPTANGIFTSTISGTFNGEAVDSTTNIGCDWSSLL